MGFSYIVAISYYSIYVSVLQFIDELFTEDNTIQVVANFTLNKHQSAWDYLPFLEAENTEKEARQVNRFGDLAFTFSRNMQFCVGSTVLFFFLKVCYVIAKSCFKKYCLF